MRGPWPGGVTSTEGIPTTSCVELFSEGCCSSQQPSSLSWWAGGSTSSSTPSPCSGWVPGPSWRWCPTPPSVVAWPGSRSASSAAVLGYYVRAALTPDTSMGRAVFAALVVALCVVVAVASVGRLPLWSALLGAATFAGSFEATYSSAPPRVVDLSIGALTTLALCVAVGFVAAGLAGFVRLRAPLGAPRRPPTTTTPPPTSRWSPRSEDLREELRVHRGSRPRRPGAGLDRDRPRRVRRVRGRRRRRQHRDRPGLRQARRLHREPARLRAAHADRHRHRRHRQPDRGGGAAQPQRVREPRGRGRRPELRGRRRRRRAAPLGLRVHRRAAARHLGRVPPRRRAGRAGRRRRLRRRARGALHRAQHHRRAAGGHLPGRPGRHRHRDRRRPDPDGRLADHRSSRPPSPRWPPSRPTWPATARAAPSSASR